MTAHYPRIDTAAAVSSAVSGAVSAAVSPSPRARPAVPATHPAGRPGLYRNGLKRVFDLVLVLLAAPAVLPVVLALALAVAVDGGRPFYSQDRIGRGGRAYRIWKLRTMVPDAETRLAAHLAADPAARAEWAVNQKLAADPRVTAMGSLLRRTSLDELPQLWNVLVGDMSLVGPRPMMVDQKPLYPGEAYYGLRPGITGSWQVSARNTSSFADRAQFDDDYDRRLSLFTDLRLLAATVRVVLRGTGC
jgi:lipopolysaccharide/colanic/teichoic acid biosynthesis glycosyltransferase